MNNSFSIIIYGYGETQLISRDKNVTSFTSALPSGESVINAVFENHPPNFVDRGLHYILIMGTSDFSKKDVDQSIIFYVGKLNDDKVDSETWFRTNSESVGFSLIQSLYNELDRS